MPLQHIQCPHWWLLQIYHTSMHLKPERDWKYDLIIVFEFWQTCAVDNAFEGTVTNDIVLWLSAISATTGRWIRVLFPAPVATIPKTSWQWKCILTESSSCHLCKDGYLKACIPSFWYQSMTAWASWKFGLSLNCVKFSTFSAYTKFGHSI